jgi:MFS superfamily sulfate permease-like transporter
VALIVPVPQIPPLSQLPRMAQLAAPIALILFAESWGTMRSLALAAGDEIAASRELMALGAANAAAALVQGIPVGAGFSAGSANAAAGATSRLSALVGALALIAFAGLGSRWLALIPEPMLAAVVIAALTHALDPKPILRLLGLGRDLWIALAALAGVLLLGVVGGMLAAIALSLAVLIYEFAHPRLSELGQVANGHDFVDIARHPEAQALPGVIVLRPNAPLFFANAEAALDAVALRAAGRGIALVVLSLEESNDLDSTALDALAEFARRLDARGQRLRLARVHDRVRELLEKAQLAQLAAGSTYSVADAAVT